MNWKLLLWLVLVLVPVPVKLESVPVGCVEIRNRKIDRFMISSTKHDADRRHITYDKIAQQWVITREGDKYRITHGSLKEDLFESQQTFNGNYVFTWVPKSKITDGGATWSISFAGTRGFFHIKNKKFNHCLYTKGVGLWIGAYAGCHGWEYEWQIHKFKCKN
uniref:Putative wrp salivary protein n=1 Tax=Corethrella appendiculata TaxID=1370023 RepID=U5ESB3_9DIPT